MADQVTTVQLEEKYSKTCTSLLHVEKQLDNVDKELVGVLTSLQDARHFDDNDIEELASIQSLWDNLYAECLKLKKEKYSLADKLRKQYIGEMKNAYNNSVKSDVKLTTCFPVCPRCCFVLYSHC